MSKQLQQRKVDTVDIMSNEEIVKEDAAPVEEVPAPEKAKAPVAVPSPRHVVSGKDADDVFLDKCVYKNVAARKSLTVHHLQRRLAELGYKEAASDKDGWYGDLTKNAVAAFQSAEKIDADTPGLMNAATLQKIFDGDANVNVII